jgi:hypothetical protein
MSYQDKIRTKLANKIFSTNAIGKTVTFISITQPTYNTRGELENWVQSTSNLQLVPYNIISEERTYKEFGPLDEGSFDAAIPYTSSVNLGDKILMESDYFLISKISNNYLPDNVVTIIRLEKIV